MPNFGYHFARWLGGIRRFFYRVFLPVIVRRPVQAARQIPLDVFSYSSEEMLPEQIASIRSFLREIGRPARFTVFSDGSHSPRSVELLKKIDSVVRVAPIGDVSKDLPERLRGYLRNHATGKQLGIVMGLPQERPALYIDADVLFFPGGPDLLDLLVNPSAPAYYLADCQFAGDERLLRNAAEAHQPANTGVLLLLRKLDWSLSISRLLEMTGEPTFFTNQTMTHLTMHQNGACAFDPAKYVLQLNDQFVFSDRYANPSLVLRHYVNPVRHKFWTSLK